MGAASGPCAQLRFSVDSHPRQDLVWAASYVSVFGPIFALYLNTITLHLGATSHSVRLWMPAYAAPEALGPWLDRFRALVKGEVEWLQLW